MILNCITCGKVITTKGAKKYCSGICYWKTLKGRHVSPLTEFSYGHIPPPTAYKKGDSRVTGKNNRLWKGNQAGYVSLHGWIHRHLGRASKCENPKCVYPRYNSNHYLMVKPRKFEWANVSRRYERNFNDWIQLCASCHQKADYYKQDLSEIKISLPLLQYN
jgi:hypothetical protein